ncbi:MAG: hypothetical protein IJY23_06075 [Clostridia bacterium]|nr:hypothetical protein [Clostridia bacterium]
MMTKLLIILGAPLWLPLLIAVAAVILSLLIVLWAVILSFWSAFTSLAVSSLGSLLLGIINVVSSGVLSEIALMLFGTSMVLAGLAIFSFIGCLYATKCSWKLIKSTFAVLKN